MRAFFIRVNPLQTPFSDILDSIKEEHHFTDEDIIAIFPASPETVSVKQPENGKPPQMPPMYTCYHVLAKDSMIKTPRELKLRRQ